MLLEQMPVRGQAGGALLLALLIVVAIQAAAVRGSPTLIQAAAVAERWGTARLDLLTGIFTAPITAATALAPTAGIGLAIVTGSFPVALLVAAAGCALGTIAVAASGSPAATGGSDFQCI